ncbi:hypothetical protein [Bifidobacterium callitrichos]|uniref:Uncharacterized protein n=1 Tax=Bifidobacterium callitrichos DSM 23973 TaxID=1437609 RepID=A0A087A905_9BIFI|nr:hypothetical protein [Bifidobacterium callitrichos]KFI55255.1 hypothetical protein BCAL_1271 [Bifidobacterium callitrichos DSM 23973]
MNTRTTPPLPRLQLQHTPGWRFDVYPERDSKDTELVVFSSDNDDFNLDFNIDVFADGAVSSSLSPGGTSEITDPTVEQLNQLADHTGRLRAWLNDLAVVAAWTDEHRAELAGMIPTSKQNVGLPITPH